MKENWTKIKKDGVNVAYVSAARRLTRLTPTNSMSCVTLNHAMS